MSKCKLCDREVYRNSKYCVFHYGWNWKYDLRYLSKNSRYDDEGKPNPKWEDKRENLVKNLDSIKEDFISEFHKYAKEVLESPPPRVLDMSRFVFPAFSREEWGRLWRPLGGDEDGEFVDFEHISVKPSFFKTIFIESVNFSSWIFGNGISFISSQFFGETKFVWTKFGNRISFSNSKFKSPVSFNSAQFGNQVSFIKSIFNFGRNDKVNFIRTKFGNGISFYKSEFKSPVSFNGARFGNQVSFVETKFYFVDFEKTNFGDGIYFDGSRIKSPASFREALFGDGISFDCYIYTSVDFSLSSIRGKFLIGNKSYIKTKIQFRFITFLSDGHIVLRGDPKFLNSISWEGTNLFQDHPRVLLSGGITWDDWPPKVGDDNFRKFVRSSNRSLEETERLYRQVRLIMEYNGRFGDAGNLYLTEMYIRTKRMINIVDDLKYEFNILLKTLDDLKASVILKVGNILIFITFLINVLPWIIINLLLQWVVDSSINPGAFIVSKILALIIGIFLVIISPIILPALVILSFIFGIILVEPMLYVYYGILSGWGERPNKPLGYVVIFSILVGLFISRNHYEEFFSLSFNNLHDTIESLKIILFALIKKSISYSQTPPPHLIRYALPLRLNKQQPLLP